MNSRRPFQYLFVLILILLMFHIEQTFAQNRTISTPGAASHPTDEPSAATASAVLPSGPQADTKKEPFAFADFTWLTGNPRTKESPLNTQAFTGEFRVDTNFTYSFNKPQDNTIGGSSEVFRSGEIQLTQLGIGGDFHHNNVQGRLMTQFGMYSQTTPRNDASPGRGQWQLDNAYRYISEAYGGYHLDTLNDQSSGWNLHVVCRAV